MRKCIILLLITGIVWAQTRLDKLVLKDGTEYLGEYLKTEREMVYFKTQKEMSLRVISTRDVQTLQLIDSTITYTNNVRTNGDFLRSKLTIEEKAVFNAKKDAQKWLAYPILAVLSSGGLATTTFFIGEDILDMSDEIIFFGSIFGGFLGLVGSYRLFSKLDKRNLEVIKTEDIESYGETYSREYEDRKLKNIVIGSGILGLTAVVVAHFMFRDFMTDYDPYFGP